MCAAEAAAVSRIPDMVVVCEAGESASAAVLACAGLLRDTWIDCERRDWLGDTDAVCLISGTAVTLAAVGLGPLAVDTASSEVRLRELMRSNRLPGARQRQ